MKKILIIFCLILPVCSLSQQADSISIINTAFDYAEGWYSGDPIRMERAIHPDFNKAIPVRMSTTSGITFIYSTFSQLVEGARAKTGILEEGKRKLTVSIIHINGDLANVRVNSSMFNDYLQVLKIDNQWKIVNVLWTVGLDSKDRIKDFNPEKENDEIKHTAKNYIEGIYSGDAKLLETVLFPDFNRLSYSLLPTGKITFRRSWSSFLIENSLQKIGYLCEPQRIYQISVLDAMEGMAAVEITTPRRFEYLQLYKDGEKWKIFHCFVKNNPAYTFNTGIVPSIEHQMMDFTLPIYQAGEFTLSKHQGKNIMLVFPRGWIGDHWCQVCQYQYAELLEIMKSNNLSKKYNLEVVFVLPYSRERISDWVSKLPEGLETIEEWKTGKNVSKEFANYIAANYPKQLTIKDNNLSIPILIDAERKVSQRFQLFTGFWDGIKSEQNIPTIFIVDEKGIIQFKYQSQTTFDRPTADYLISILKALL